MAAAFKTATGKSERDAEMYKRKWKKFPNFKVKVSPGAAAAPPSSQG